MRKRDHIGDIAATVFFFMVTAAIGISYATTPHDNERRVLDTTNRIDARRRF
jgi:hypothetical protein